MSLTATSPYVRSNTNYHPVTNSHALANTSTHSFYVNGDHLNRISPELHNLAAHFIGNTDTGNSADNHQPNNIALLANAENELRLPGRIYITGHHVQANGLPTHLAIEYSNGSKSRWLSAGPEGGNLVSGLGTPTNGVRPTDHYLKNFTVAEVRPPANMSPSDFFNKLIETDKRYCDCVDYDLFPAIADSYNSNSYVRGLLNAAGGSTNINWGNYVGGSKPLPYKYFNPPQTR